MLALAKNRCFFAGNILLALGFVFQEATPFFLSVGAILTGASALLPPFSWKGSVIPISLMVLWGLGLVSGLYSENSQEWGRVVTRQLALVFIPLAFLSGHSLSSRQKHLLNLSWIGTLAAFACLSLFRYLLNKQAVDAALLHSGAIPIWDGKSWPWQLTALNHSKFLESGVNHIYFSVLQAAAILCSFFLYQQSKKKLWLVLGVIHLVSIHWFLARTGLLALYGAGLSMLFYSLLHSKRKKGAVLILVAIVSLPLLSYVFLGSVRNKVESSLEDLEAVRGSRDINHRSLAMRLEAWENAWYIINKHPMGVGLGDASGAMKKAYDERHSALWPENRIPPHNQYLESTLAIGFPGSLILIFGLISSLVLCWKRGFALGLGITVALTIALMFESLLQTQLGICLFPFLLLFVATPDRERNLLQA